MYLPITYCCDNKSLSFPQQHSPNGLSNDRKLLSLWCETNPEMWCGLVLIFKGLDILALLHRLSYYVLITGCKVDPPSSGPPWATFLTVFQSVYRHELETRLSPKPWKQEIAKIPDWPRRKAVAKFRWCIGHDCLGTHLHRTGTLPDPYSMQPWTETI